MLILDWADEVAKKAANWKFIYYNRFAAALSSAESFCYLNIIS